MSFCRRACCTGFCTISASCVLKKSSTSSSMDGSLSESGPSLPLGLTESSQLLRFFSAPMSPQLLTSCEELASTGHVIKIIAGQFHGPPGDRSRTFPAPLPSCFTSLSCPEAHRRIAPVNSLFFSATTIAYEPAGAPSLAGVPSFRAFTTSSPVDTAVTTTPHRDIVSLKVCRTIALESYSKTWIGESLEASLNVIAAGTRCVVLYSVVSAPLARTRRRAIASFSASAFSVFVPPGTPSPTSPGAPVSSPGTASHRMSNRNVLPRPRPGDSAHIRPPIASQRRWLIAKPSPVPSYFRVGERSTCWNELKIRLTSPQFKPMPVSLMSN
mmetsp:Transcript_11085/g.40125  ORF Transcript_11085/g.40125 Transcript_11085/m.40125 type:complete len:327 (-) Transcript_11085:2037-3017(-)